MKRIYRSALAAIALTVSTVSLSASMGGYIGLGAGEGKVKTPDNYPFSVDGLPDGTNSRSQNGLAGRAFLGYNITKFVGVEGGYTKYSTVSYIGEATGYYGSYKYYFHTWDAVAKGYLPLGDFFNMYGILGLARIAEKLDYTNNGIPLSGTLPEPASSTQRLYKTRPLYGVGLNYEFAKRFSASLEAIYVQESGSQSNSTNATPGLDFFSLNISYFFC